MNAMKFGSLAVATKPQPEKNTQKGGWPEAQLTNRNGKLFGNRSYSCCCQSATQRQS